MWKHLAPLVSIALTLQPSALRAEPQGGWPGAAARSAGITGTQRDELDQRFDQMDRLQRQIQERDNAISRSICQGC